MPLANGGYRNHCPECLWSRHLDISPGDRQSSCRALMRPVAVEQRGGKGLVIVHQCTGCGFSRPNRIADDLVQGDCVDALIALGQAGGRRLL